MISSSKVGKIPSNNLPEVFLIVANENLEMILCIMFVN